ncbi:MAG: hypothetical protein QGG09_13605, partial [Pirellulaceae bacterium]|nr:hypothetical protein [Pirellulaceae bacterium]
MTEPKSAPNACAPDGVAEARHDVPEVFADVKYPAKNFPPIELVTTNRAATQPFITRECFGRDIRGPRDWPDDTPVQDMTATYVPVETDIRYCNANYNDQEERPENESRLGHFHYYNEVFRRLIIDHFVITGEDRLLVGAKAQTYVHGTDDAFLIALSPGFKGIDDRRDPDGSAPLPGQGPTKLTKYWPEAKEHMISALPQPLRGDETELVIIGDDILCLGPTRTPVANIGKLLSETHSFNPDHFLACRHGKFEDVADMLDAIVAPYRQSVDTSGPDGSAINVQNINAYPGTVLIVLGGYEFIRPTMAGDENEVTPISDDKAKILQSIAETLADCHRCCVLLPPPAAKFGLGPIFDDNTARMAQIFAEQGIVYYRPAMWMELQMYQQYYPLDTVNNRRVYMRIFQCLLRITEWYGMVRDKYCANGSIVQTKSGPKRKFYPHNCDPDHLI